MQNVAYADESFKFVQFVGVFVIVEQLIVIGRGHHMAKGGHLLPL